jgi:hypothetical protein
MEKSELPIVTAATDSQTRESFVEEFKNYMTSKSDVSSTFQEAVALNLVSLAIGRTPIDTNFDEEMLPNVWTMLVGYSTYSRKSTILKEARRVMPTGSNSLPDEFTKEAFFNELAKNSKGLNIWDECASVLKQLNNTKSYLHSIDDTLMALYNGETRTKALQKGNITVEDPCFNLLWATTYTNFGAYVDKESFSTGFMSRYLVVFGDDCANLRLLSGQTSEETKQYFTTAKAKLQEIWNYFHANEHKFVLSERAEGLINGWIAERHKQFVDCELEDKDFFASVSGRAQEYVIKLSAIYEADAYQLSKLSNGNTIEISEESAAKSIDFMNNVISMISDKYAKLLSLDWLSKNLAKLSSILEKQPEKKAQRQFLSPRMHVNAKQLTDVLATAEDYGMIEICKGKPMIIALLKTYEDLKTTANNTKHYEVAAELSNTPQVKAVAAAV